VKKASEKLPEQVSLKQPDLVAVEESKAQSD
jgi:hypothetical protein